MKNKGRSKSQVISTEKLDFIDFSDAKKAQRVQFMIDAKFKKYDMSYLNGYFSK